MFLGGEKVIGWSKKSQVKCYFVHSEPGRLTLLIYGRACFVVFDGLMNSRPVLSR